MGAKILLLVVSGRLANGSRIHIAHSRLGGDLLAGISVASILIPISVSYATSLAKLNPLTGLVSNTPPMSSLGTYMISGLVFSFHPGPRICVPGIFKRA